MPHKIRGRGRPRIEQTSAQPSEILEGHSSVVNVTQVPETSSPLAINIWEPLTISRNLSMKKNEHYCLSLPELQTVKTVCVETDGESRSERREGETPPAKVGDSKDAMATTSIPSEDIDVTSLPKPHFEKISSPDESNGVCPFERPKNHYIHHSEPTEADLMERVEYDMDEEDCAWLEVLNNERAKENIGQVPNDLFEFVMDRLEKESFHLTRDLKLPPSDGVDIPDDSACQICNDNEGENINAIVFCDGCNLAVHQDCYGIPYIPEGQWLCRKCDLSPNKPVSCIFCPYRGGAFKQTNTNTWAHLLCAIWIPEVSLGNSVYMEPVENIDRIPKSRWKLICSLCYKRQGACIQCDNRYCFTAFHATCAQRAQLCMLTSTHADGSLVLKAYCDRHRPPEYRLQGAMATLDSTCQSLDVSSNTLAHQRSSVIAVPCAQIPGGHRKRKRRDRRRSLNIDTGRTSRSATQYPSIYYSSGTPIIPDGILDKLEHLPWMIDSFVKNKADLITTICHYWTLKRDSRRGALLLKRLQLEPWRTASPPLSDVHREEQHTSTLRLRSDLEKVRMLAGQVQKREKFKLDRLRKQKAYLDTALFPASSVAQIFLDLLIQEANAMVCTDWLNTLHDLCARVRSHSHDTLEAFESDFEQVLQHLSQNMSLGPFCQMASLLLEHARHDYAQRLLVRAVIPSDLFTYSQAPKEPNRPKLLPTQTKKPRVLPPIDPTGRRRTRSTGSDSLETTAQELKRKRGRLAREAWRLFSSYTTAAPDTPMETDLSRDAPPGWVYLKKDPDDQDVSNNEEENEHRQRSRPVKFPEPAAPLTPGSVVWARVHGFPAHPATIVDRSKVDIPHRILQSQSHPDDLLVEFFTVPDRCKWGWIGKRDIRVFGFPEVDKAMLLQAKKSKRRARIREAQEGFRHACEHCDIDPEPLVQQVFYKRK